MGQIISIFLNVLLGNLNLPTPTPENISSESINNSINEFDISSESINNSINEFDISSESINNSINESETLVTNKRIKQNLPSVSNLYSQTKNLNKGSLQLNEPMAWCPNEDKTSCVSSPISKKPHDCFGDFSKEQCERSRLKKVKKQNLQNINNLVTQKRNVGFIREAPKAWCPKKGKGLNNCEYRILDSTCNPPSLSEQQCLDKLPCQLIKSYKGSDKEKIKKICRKMSNTKELCLQDNAQRNAEELGAHCVWKGEVCLPNKSLIDTANKNGWSERFYTTRCKVHSMDNNCEGNYGKNLTDIFKNNETDLCKTFYN